MRERASFGRIIVTPLIVLIAAVAVGMLVPDWLLLALAIAAVLSVVYIVVASRGSSASREDMYRELSALADLRDKGVLTPEDFDRRKREMLDRL